MSINVGDYVEPIEEIEVHDDINYEDLCGFVTAKNGKMITVNSIGRNIETDWNEDKFIKSEIPSFFKNHGQTRVKK